MQLGMIGLGRMGANMVRRLIKQGHQCVVFDKTQAVVQELAKEKAIGAASLADFGKKLDIAAQLYGAWINEAFDAVVLERPEPPHRLLHESGAIEGMKRVELNTRKRCNQMLVNKGAAKIFSLDRSKDSLDCRRRHKLRPFCSDFPSCYSAAIGATS